MKYLRFWMVLGILGLLAAVGSVALPRSPEPGDKGFSSGSYLVTFKDSVGNFASRSVITLHSDQTMSVTDSAQGGPTFYFSSQLGSWKTDSQGRIAARTIDFNYPPGPGVARLDYSLTLSRDMDQVTGTGTLTIYPLEDGDPLHTDGTVVGNFTLAGELIKP